MLPFRRPLHTAPNTGNNNRARKEKIPALPGDGAADYARSREASFDASKYFTTFDFCAHPRRFLGHKRRYSSSGESVGWEATWDGCAGIAKARQQLLQCQARRPLDENDEEAQRRRSSTTGTSSSGDDHDSGSLSTAGRATVAAMPFYSDPTRSLLLVPSLAPSYSAQPDTKYPTFFPASPPRESFKEEPIAQQVSATNISTHVSHHQISNKATRAAASEAAAVPLPVFTMDREEWLAGTAATLCHLRWHVTTVVVGVSNEEDAAAVEDMVLAAPDAPSKVDVLRVNSHEVENTGSDLITTTISSTEARTRSKASGKPRSEAGDDADLVLKLMGDLKAGLQPQQNHAESVSIAGTPSWASAELVYFALPTRVPLFDHGAFVDASALVAPFAYVSPQPLVLVEASGNQEEDIGNRRGGAYPESAWRLPDGAVAVKDSSSTSGNSGGEVNESAQKATIVTESSCAAEAREVVTWADGGDQSKTGGSAQWTRGRRWPLALLSPVCVARDETIGATMRLRHTGGGGGHKR